VNDIEARTLIIELLKNIAPEGDFRTLAGGTDLREALDLDSIDFLNFVTALHERTGKDIPEADYPSLFTLDQAARYIVSP
jgi:acyl carrier protein